MTCLTCARRRKECDDKRPRCSLCKSSHLRCAYNTPPTVLQIQHENPGKHGECGGNVITGDASQAQPSLQQDHLLSSMTENAPDTLHKDHTQLPSSLVALDDSLFADFISSWDDEFPDLPNLNDQFLTFPLEAASSDAELTSPNHEGQNAIYPRASESSVQIQNTAPLLACQNGPWEADNAEPPNKRPRVDELPTHLLAQHYSRALAGRFSFKRPDWTFYTYFYHRFARSHPVVLSAILAWTSANLFFVEQVDSLSDSIAHYEESLALIKEIYSISLLGFQISSDMTDYSWPWLAQNDDDRDALFVACFFLALVDLALARSEPLRKTIHFIAMTLQSPIYKATMTGVQARVISWFCILDGKASAFQPADGSLLQALGTEEEIVRSIRLSSRTLQDAYSITYPEEERKSDERQHPLLELMLQLSFLLHRITKLGSDCPANKIEEKKDIRQKLDSYHQAISQDLNSGQHEGRNQCTYLVLCALYHSVEISYSRRLAIGDQRHAADRHARDIIQISQQLKALRPSGSKMAPPPTKFWPLPLVMAAIEVKDLVYRDWAIQTLEGYEKTSGDHYVWSRRFVEAMCQREDEASCRLDWSSVLSEVKDGLVI